jgi:hypothetical protein
MPNWCSNSITITSNKDNIDKFEAFLNEKNGKEWFDFFLPCPEELRNVDSPNETKNTDALLEKYGHVDWYSWSVENWGTKWNCDSQDWNRDGDSISFWFDSAWAPPTNLYEKIFGEGYEVEAYYLEEGMQFVGKFSDGSDEYYEYSDSESLNDIPEDIVDNWNLRENLEEWEAENAEEEDDEESSND